MTFVELNYVCLVCAQNHKQQNIFIKKNPTRCNNVSNFIIPYLYEAQHILGDTPPETCWASYKYGI